MVDFLIVLAVVWLAVASYSDLKKREVPNWLSFSLIAFALAYRALYSVFNSDYKFFLFGLLGFLVFYVLAHVFYYARIFAGGDAKLLMGLGAILPSANIIGKDLAHALFFLFLLFAVGGVYGILYSLIYVSKNKKKFSLEFNKQIKERKGLVFIFIVFAVFSLLFFILQKEAYLLLVPVVFILFPFLFIYARSVENSCMIIEIPGNKATIGDWLYKEVKVGGKKIKPYWEGLSENEVKMLKNVKKIKVKQGIPFVPSFLIAFLLFLILRESFWSFFQWFF